MTIFISDTSKIKTHIIKSEDELPAWLTFEDTAEFLHLHMAPYEDSVFDVKSGLNYALSKDGKPGGFILITEYNQKVLGIVVMLRTGMKGYIPENLLLFACVHPESRGQGLGKKLIDHAIKTCNGNIKLHVEYDNPAKELYERIGFTNKYAEMRYEKDAS